MFYLYVSLHLLFYDVLDLQFVSILLFLKLLLDHLLDFYLLLVLLLLKLVHRAPRTSDLISLIELAAVICATAFIITVSVATASSSVVTACIIVVVVVV